MYAPQSTAALRPTKSLKHLKVKPNLPKTSTSTDSTKNDITSSFIQGMKQAKLKRSWLGLGKKESEITTPVGLSLLSSDVNTTVNHAPPEPLTSDHQQEKAEQLINKKKKKNGASSKEVAAYVNNNPANIDISHHTNGLMNPADTHELDFSTLYLSPDMIEKNRKSAALNEGLSHTTINAEQHPQTPPGGDGYNRFWLNGRFVFAFDNDTVITDYDQDRASDWGQEELSPRYNIEPTIRSDKGKARAVSADFTPDRREVAQTSRFEVNKNDNYGGESKLRRSTFNLNLHAADQAASSNLKTQNPQAQNSYNTTTQTSLSKQRADRGQSDYNHRATNQATWSKQQGARVNALFQEPIMQVQDDFNPTGVVHKMFFDPSIDAMIKKYPEARTDLGVLRVLCSSLAAQLEYDATKGLKRRHNKIERSYARLMKEEPNKLAEYYLNKWSKEDPDQYKEITSIALLFIARGLIKEDPDEFMKFMGDDIMEEINTQALENPEQFVEHFGQDFGKVLGMKKSLEIVKLQALIKDNEDLIHEFGDKITQREEELDESHSYTATLKESKEWMETRLTSLIAEKERSALQLKQSGERFRREQKDHDQLVLYLERQNTRATEECRIVEHKLAQEKDRVSAQQLHIQNLELRLGITAPVGSVPRSPIRRVSSTASLPSISEERAGNKGDGSSTTRPSEAKEGSIKSVTEQLRATYLDQAELGQIRSVSGNEFLEALDHTQPAVTIPDFPTPPSTLPSRNTNRD